MAPKPDPRPTAPASDEALAAPRRGLLAAGWAKFSDNAAPTLVVAVIVGLMLFIFSETSDRITRLEADIDARFVKLEENQQDIAVALATLVARFTQLEDEIDTRFAAVDTRFTQLEDEIDTRFAAVDTRFAAVDARFDKLEDEIDTRFTQLEDEIDTRFAAVDARFDKLEDEIDTRFAAADARFDKLEENQQEIAQTLARLVALVEAGDEAEAAPAG